MIQQVQLLKYRPTKLHMLIKLCFTDSAHNPFELTKQSQKKALDYENNLCYCYDCDDDNNDKSGFEMEEKTPLRKKLLCQLFREHK